MRLRELSPEELRRRLRGRGLDLLLGPFSVRVRSPFPELAYELGRLYADQRVAAADFHDYHVAVSAPRGPRRWIRPQSLFLLDGLRPFMPLPRSQCVPLLEWGLNWCIASHAHQYLILHAAVIERRGRAVVLPADSGAGKSTLCAALVYSGWRLLSDELAMLDFDDGELHSLARPVSLKNESIDVIGTHLPDAVISRRCVDTSKGTVALLKPPTESVDRVDEPALPAWVVTPEFRAGAEAVLEPASRATTFMELAHNGFNYSIHGAAGFDALARLVDRSECYHFTYSRLSDAIEVFDAMSESAA